MDVLNRCKEGFVVEKETMRLEDMNKEFNAECKIGRVFVAEKYVIHILPTCIGEHGVERGNEGMDCKLRQYGTPTPTKRKFARAVDRLSRS